MIKPVPGLAIEQQPSSVLSRMLLYGEARNQPAIGALAVLSVVYNRASQSGKTVRDEILKPWQFSSFNQNDPNRALLLDAWKTDPVSWSRADAICELYEEHATPDPTKGATHYYNPSVVQPAWGRGSSGWTELAVIDDHVFGRAA